MEDRTVYRIINLVCALIIYLIVLVLKPSDYITVFLLVLFYYELKDEIRELR